MNIKVDREERPDLDPIYMEAVQVMTGQGGWPMTVFLTPDGSRSTAAPTSRRTTAAACPGFPRVLASVADAWTARAATTSSSSGEQLRTRCSSGETAQPRAARSTPALLDQAQRMACSPASTRSHGGFGRRPEVPAADDARVPAAQLARRTGATAGAGSRASITLDKMARGGIYDQLGGGFHRYSIDARWLVPHFEKMLYDNAQLARVYLQAYQAHAASRSTGASPRRRSTTSCAR